MSEKFRLNIAGMSCANCSNAIEKSTAKIKGVKKSSVSFANSMGEFELENAEILPLVKEKITKLGFEIATDFNDLQNRKKAHIKALLLKFCLALIISTLIMFFEMSENFSFKFKALICAILGLFVLIFCANEFYKHGFLSLKNRNFDMNVLIILGSSVSYFYSLFVAIFGEKFGENHLYFSASAMIITFILLGKFLEENSKFKANDYIKKLIDLSPKTALKIGKNGEICEILADEIKINDKILVKSGMQIPADGKIIEGGAEIDTSMITGESLPKYCKIGDFVHAGTMNLNGTIYILVTKAQNKALLSQILELLNEAGTKKMPIARIADKIANIFVPSVIIIAICVFLIWWFLGNALTGVICAICVLIISCPCALGLATPIAIVCAISNAAKKGILIRNPEILEIAKDIKVAVFDKTGTLSSGEISVFRTNLSTENLKILASAEILSEHKISQAIVKFATQKFGEILKFEGEFKSEIGQGISAKNAEISLIAGNFEFLKNNGVNFEINGEINELLQNGFGVIFVAINSQFVGFVALNDEIKQNAKSVILALKNRGIKPVMLSGDNAKTAKFIAEKLGISEFYAEVLPNEKYEILSKIMQNQSVIFIGDGINDAPALKLANIGIAMNSGSDIAKGAGDAIFIKNDLENLLFLLDFSTLSMRTIKQNLFWAFFYNLICIPVAAGAFAWAGILLKPMYGAFAMCFSSICVVLNSIRLKFLK